MRRGSFVQHMMMMISDWLSPNPPHITIPLTGNQIHYMHSRHVLKWPIINLFNSNHSWANESEHLDIEYIQLSENEMDNAYLLDEINFIVNNIEGKPVRNYNQ